MRINITEQREYEYSTAKDCPLHYERAKVNIQVRHGALQMMPKKKESRSKLIELLTALPPRLHVLDLLGYAEARPDVDGHNDQLRQHTQN